MPMTSVSKKSVIWVRMGFSADPDVDRDPAFFVNAHPDTGYGPGSRALMTKNWIKFTADKNLYFFLSKIAI
jgi:hypothetical protein